MKLPLPLDYNYVDSFKPFFLKDKKRRNKQTPPPPHNYALNYAIFLPYASLSVQLTYIFRWLNHLRRSAMNPLQSRSWFPWPNLFENELLKLPTAEPFHIGPSPIQPWNLDRSSHIRISIFNSSTRSNEPSISAIDSELWSFSNKTLNPLIKPITRLLQTSKSTVGEDLAYKTTESPSNCQKMITTSFIYVGRN